MYIGHVMVPLSCFGLCCWLGGFLSLVGCLLTWILALRVLGAGSWRHWAQPVAGAVLMAGVGDWVQ